MHQSPTTAHTPNFIKIEETFCGRTDGRADGRTFETHFRSTQRSRPKNGKNQTFKIAAQAIVVQEQDLYIHAKFH